MAENSTARRMLAAYAEHEPWLRHHEEAMRCLDFEERLVWGMGLFRTLNEIEARIQAQLIKMPVDPAIAKLPDFDACYIRWLEVSEGYLATARGFASSGYEIPVLEEFSVMVEEARAMIENNSLEHEMPSIDRATSSARPASISTTATRAPSAAMCRQVAAPIPEAPPVTNAR